MAAALPASQALPLRVAGLGAALLETIVPASALEARLGLPPGWIEATHGIRERRAAELGMVGAGLSVARRRNHVAVSD